MISREQQFFLSFNRMSRLELDTRLELVKLYYSNHESAAATLRAYKSKHSLRRDPFPLSTITRLVQKFEKTKTLHDSKSSGRPSKEDERTDEVLESMSELQASNPLRHASARGIARTTGINKSSVLKILHSNGLSPYHIQVCQAITETDKIKRLEFANWVLENQETLKHVLWSDEAYFSLDGLVNRHNCVIWSYENPKAVIPRKLHPEKICVWMGFSSDYKLEPYFFQSTVDQQQYSDMIRDHLIPYLQANQKMDSVIFQHDGAPPHFSRTVRSLLASNFDEDHIIGRGYGIPWPPRSPDLTPVDFYFWGMLKARVYHQFRPSSLQELQQRISTEIQNVTINELERAVSHLTKRAELVIQEGGNIIEHLL